MKRRKKRYNQRDWAEVFIIFLFLAAAVLVFGMVGAFIMDVIFRLT